MIPFRLPLLQDVLAAHALMKTVLNGPGQLSIWNGAYLLEAACLPVSNEVYTVYCIGLVHCARYKRETACGSLGIPLHSSSEFDVAHLPPTSTIMPLPLRFRIFSTGIDIISCSHSDSQRRKTRSLV